MEGTLNVAHERTTPTPSLSPDSFNAAYKQTTTVAMAIVAALPIYVVIAEILMRNATRTELPETLGTLRIVMFVVAGMVIFTTTLLKGILLRSAPPDAPGRLARLRTATIVALGLSEMPAIFGLILVLLGSTRADFYMLLAISGYMMVRHFPRRGAWEEYVRRGSTLAVR